MANPTEQRELELVDKVDFRILAVANNEEKLQDLLSKFLAPLLLKLASEHASVRKKVIDICQRLKTYVKTPGVVLPVSALLDQYKAADNALLKLYDSVFIQHSLGRLEQHERRNLIPKAIKGIGSDTSPSRDSLFNVILRLLPDLKLPPRGSKDDVALREELGISDPKDAEFLAFWIGKLVLFRVQATDDSPPPPGLDPGDVKFLSLGKQDTWDPRAGGLNLADVRIKALGFLSSGAFTDKERYIPALYAASSSDFRVSEIGENLLKRSSVSLEDEKLVKELFEAHSKLPPRFRTRVLNLLSKSEISTTFTSDILGVFLLDMRSELGSDAASGASRLELSKLQRALFEYINWVARIASDKPHFTEIRTTVVGHLRQFIERQGWPKPQQTSLDDAALRSTAYETIGVLVKGKSMPEAECLSLATWLFRSLSEDPTPDAVVNIDGALSTLASTTKPPHSSGLDQQLHAVLLTYMTLEEKGEFVRSARHAAVKWANRCLPFSDIQARWIDILAIAGRLDERSDVVDEGRKGLDPWTYFANDDKSRLLPDWAEMVRKFFGEHITPSNPTRNHNGSGETEMDVDIDPNSAFVNFQGESLRAFPIALDYCRRILFLTALDHFNMESGWERQLETLLHSDLESRQQVRNYLASLPEGVRALSQLLAAAFEGMTKEGGEVSETSATCFVDIASFAPRSAVEPLGSRSLELLPLLSSNKKEIRALGAKALGILNFHNTIPASKFETLMDNLVRAASTLKTAVGSDLNAAEGAFLGWAQVVSNKRYNNHLLDTDAIVRDEFLTLDSISSLPSSTQETLYDAYSQFWTAGIVPLPKEADVSDPVAFLNKAFVEPLVVQAKKGNEKAVTALGRLGLSCPEQESGQEEGGLPGSSGLVEVILLKLFDLYELKQAEIHFAVGEAITAVVARWNARVVQLTMDVETADGPWKTPRRTAQLTSVLDKLLKDAKTTKPSLLKASGIWLFCLIQHCSHLEEVKTRLRECQTAFMRLLSARDELVQETASRGLSLVYEKGDAQLKTELVRDLVAAFTGTGPQLKVDQETELFEAGALPTGEGKSITSYKDIVSLANEVGDQSLVYKLMSLATNAATWSTRSAFGRFGLSNILSESEIDPKLYPKLYRYRFDPNTNVQKSMDDIWKALVKDPSAVLETYFDAIMKDLLKSILGKEWRVREASCAAISDLISGRPFPKYEPYYKDIWAAALKVLDDVKATVRNAALHLCIALSTTLVRQLEDSGTSAAATAMMNEALPFLMSEKGIESGVEDVKMFSTVTVIKIAKSGGKSLHPYIPTMVPHLLGLLSTIEPQAINYHYQRAGEDHKEKIDRLRSAMVSQSPITEAIENCLRTADSDVMSKLSPGLEEAIKTAVGMPTKVGCSRVLTTLATRHANDFRPYAARFLQLMEKQSLDRNDEVSQNYARAAAYLVRVVSDEAKQRFAERLLKLYLESEDETRRQKVADAVLALSKISPDHFNALEGRLLPFAFLGKHDTDEYVQKEFEEVWSKHAGSSLTVSRYIPEIVDLVQRSLNTAQWALKHAGALAIASAAASITSASDVTGHVNMENLKAVWPVYDKSLALKTFANKEKLLEPFPEFVQKSKAWWGEDAAFGEQLKKIAIREAKRNNDEYRPHAFRCLWRFAAVRDDLVILPEIAKIVTPYFDVAKKDEDEMDVDKSTKNDTARGMDPKSRMAWAAVEAVAKGYNRRKMKENPLSELREIVVVLEENSSSKGSPSLDNPYIARTEFDSIRRAYWYDCATELLEAAEKGDAKSTEGNLDVVKWYLASLDLDRADAGTEAQRVSRAKATGTALRLLKRHGGAKEPWLGKVKEAMEKALGEERSLEVQAKWRESLAVVSSG
ncbi:proteasome stabiliser-domain-containing protein [Echria macrotheca]|uniref:Proteasome stabiliser-domain-containing protein n=1 Tax=Echria macrotheca TaxID=438768 RepID=A0AAJ0FDQ9_9PEZI|nr:proteasome stabiliser-domain-containing protein [Echria macrotheca]